MLLDRFSNSLHAMDFVLSSTIAGFFTLLFLILSYLSRRSIPAAKGKLAPEASGGWPIIGHLPLLANSKLPHKTLAGMADKHGPVFSLRLGVHRALVVSSSEMAKECFSSTNDLALASRPKLVALKHLGYNYAMFGTAIYGPYWRELRKISTSELLSIRRLELLKHIRVSEMSTFLKILYTSSSTWSKTEKVKGSVSVEMNQLFAGLSLNVILRMVAGKRFFYGHRSVGHDQTEASRLHKVIREFFNLLGIFVIGDAIPCLGWLDLGGSEKAMKKTAKELDDIIGEWLEEHKRNRSVGESETKDKQDFMDVLLSVLPSGLEGYDADTINKATILSLIAGGSDTITVTMTWAVSLLLNNRHVLKKVKDELDVHVGPERLVDESDISKLVYLQAVVKETLRLYPPAPLSAPREFTEDCTIGGYYVPKGTRLITNLWKIQTDPEIWADNPLAFNPERFLTTQKDVDVRGQHFEMIPFGSGRRVCPGISFALVMVNFSLASFLHAFEITTPSDEPIDMSESFGLTCTKATPLEVVIEPRLSSELYGVDKLK